MDLQAIVAEYRRDHKPGLDREIAYFAAQPSLVEAIERAALAQMPYGKHPHQRRRKTSTLRAAADALLRAEGGIQNCKTFEALYETVEAVTDGIRDFGPLCVYDTALRIGAYLGLQPERVYLHAGTRKGCAHFTVDASADSLPVDLFPAPLAQFGCADLENLLCLYKDSLAGTGSSASGCRPLPPPTRPPRSCR